MGRCQMFAMTVLSPPPLPSPGAPSSSSLISNCHGIFKAIQNDHTLSFETMKLSGRLL